MRHISNCLRLLLFAAMVFIAVPVCARETAVIQPGFFAADRQGDFLRARGYAERGAMQNLQLMFDQDIIFTLPEGVTVEIQTTDSQTLTSRIGVPRSGTYYWTDIEAVIPGYRSRIPVTIEQRAEQNRRAAEQGGALAQMTLGAMYAGGYGVGQNYRQAIVWYRKAAEQGFAPAQVNLGWMYEHGRGVEVNYGQAAIWYRRAAEQGESLGQANLGRMYVFGRGVERNNERALEWFRKAAAQGHSGAEEAIERLQNTPRRRRR